MLILPKCSIGYALQLSPVISSLTAADFPLTLGPREQSPKCPLVQ
jgi:hypothetical protein